MSESIELRKGVCAWCFHWHIDAPEGWEPPSYDKDAEPELRDWMRHAEKKHGADAILHWPRLFGKCGVDPTWVETGGSHGCARYVDKQLTEPSAMADNYCNRGWKDYRMSDIREKNEKLKRQVAHHKKLAETRLERLRAQKIP